MLRAIVILIGLYCFASCGPKKEDKPKSEFDFPSLAKINKEIRKHPEDAVLHFERASQLHDLGKDSLAILDLLTAVKKDSTQAKFYSAIADLHFEHKNITESVKYIQKAIEIDPNDEIAHLKMAKLFFFMEEYPKAFTEINTVLRANARNAEAYYLKGMCYKYMGDEGKALSSFQTAAQTENNYVDAYMELGRIHSDNNNPLALEYFENAYKSDTTNLDPLYDKAMYWQHQKKYAEAKKIFRRCISLDQDYAKAYYNTGYMLLQEDSVEKAKRQFDMAIKAQPDYMEAYFNRGLCAEILGSYEEAKLEYEQALVFNAEYKNALEALERVKKKIK